MKQAFSFILIAMVTMSAMAQTKKYDIKSATISFETTMKMSGMNIKEKVIVYFDDYGIKECRDTYSDGKLKESFFSDGKNLFTVVHKEKTAYNRGGAYRGTEMKFDWNEISDKDKKGGKAKKLANTTVAGKPCESYEYTDGGTTSKYYGWNHVLLMSDIAMKDISNVTKAVKVDEKTPVPPEKFKAPAGYAVK